MMIPILNSSSGIALMRGDMWFGLALQILWGAASSFMYSAIYEANDSFRFLNEGEAA
ncbi:MAG: hypothetical protein ABI230_07900 [Aestuariivirga sp.]